MQNQSQQQGQQPYQGQQQPQYQQNYSNQPQSQQSSFQQGQQPYSQQVQNNSQSPQVVQMQGSKQLQNPQSVQQSQPNQSQQNFPSGQSQTNFNDISSQKQQQPYNSQNNPQTQSYTQPQAQMNQTQAQSQIPQAQNNTQYQNQGQNMNQSQTQPLNYQNQPQSQLQSQQSNYQNPPQSQPQSQQFTYQNQPQTQQSQPFQNQSQLPQPSAQQPSQQFPSSSNPLPNQSQTQQVQPQQPLNSQPQSQQPLTQQPQQQNQPQQPQSQEQLVNQPQTSQQLPKPEEVIDETNLTGPQIVNYIKKKPYTQKVGTRQYTYSVLSKKQKTFVMSNDRFLILKGIEEISYAREFDAKKNTVPFVEEQQIPKPKSTYPIMEIEKVESTQEKLNVFFAGAKKEKWQFVCPSKDCSLKWKTKITDAMAAFKQFKDSGLDNYEVFLKMKQGQQQNSQINNQNPNLLPNQQQAQFGVQQGQGNLQNGNLNQSNIRQQGNGSKIWNSSLQGEKQFSANSSHFNNPNRSNEIFKGPQGERIENFITDKQQQPRQYLSQSMSRIPMEQREKIKHDIRQLRRNWIEQLIGGQEEVELLISFNNYVQRISQVIINELYIHNSVKIFPSHQTGKDFISYLLDDIYIEVYLVSEQQQNTKNPRYKNAVLEFKNYDYLLSATKNQGPLKVPLMTIFEFKGFLGMAKSKIGQSKGFKNRQFYDNVDRRQFEELTKISAEALLNQAKCKIISYDRPQAVYNFANKPQKLYFLQTFLEFLPNQNTKQFGLNKDNILRAQLVKDQSLEDQLFRDRSRQVRNDKINDLIDKQIDELVKVLECQYDYFANSQELTQIIHLYGLNVRYIGMLFKKTKLKWLKKLLQAEISARCLKNYFRKEIQSSFFYNSDQGVNRQRQEERQRAKVINFLNIVFGNNQPTFRLWRSLNNTAQEKYHVRIWDDKYSDVNSGYLLQAIQTHFKIVLNPQVANRKVFATSNSFQLRDFVKFNFDCSIYNLDFTSIFTQINDLLEDESSEAFQDLCDLLTRQNSSNLPYLQILQKHPIHNSISKYMLTFASPEDTPDLYRKIENVNIPHKLLFDGKFAEIKWYLKTNKQDRVNNSISYTMDIIRRWFGDLHPLYSQFNRMLAQFYSEQQFFDAKALKFANSSLSMQQALFEGDHEQIWKDYYLIGKIHFLNSRQEESLSYLVKAKNLVRVQSLNNHFEAYGQLCLMLSKVYFTARYFKQSYTTVRELYKLIREERDEKSLHFIVEAVGLIKQLLQINQQHESYYRFVQADFSSIIYAFADYPKLMLNSIKMITIPYLKNVILRNSKNKAKLLGIIEEVSKIKQSTQSCQTYIKAKIREGVFPKSYLHYLKDIDAVVDQIIANQMILRWKSYNTYANESILDKIGASQINRGFQFLANMTALFNFLGQEVLEELFIMEK